MSNQKRANEMGRQHRMICGAMGRRGEEGLLSTFSCSLALPAIRTPLQGDVLLAQGEMREGS